MSQDRGLKLFATRSNASMMEQVIGLVFPGLIELERTPDFVANIS